MKRSIFSFFLAVVLLSEFYLESSAMPMEKAEDITSDQDSLDEGLAGNALSIAPASTRIIVVADPGLLRTLKVLDRGTTHLNGPESVFTAERREVNQEPRPNIAIIKRDTMRCMVGRVYRPCWEV
ncbi:pro-melanin-concentrating hormone, like [Chanos chanos]|uniref:Pro-melanin-concentrating hormone, like n=1 Tax=Chanos chanos TaxID=29144 RepID=A0A6J2UXH8_CHACN|nr:pro-MCH 1-like [Chanos chanos]